MCIRKRNEIHRKWVAAIIENKATHRKTKKKYTRLTRLEVMKSWLPSTSPSSVLRLRAASRQCGRLIVSHIIRHISRKNDLDMLWLAIGEWCCSRRANAYLKCAQPMIVSCDRLVEFSFLWLSFSLPCFGV